jgi:hypothetical protein
MKQITLISFVVLSFIVISQCGKPKPIAGKLDNSRFKKASALTAALILKRLGSKQSTNALFKRIRTHCSHLRFLGRRLYRKFPVTKKLRNNVKSQKSFAKNFVSFVLRRLLSCKVVAKNTLSFKLKNALRRSKTARNIQVVIRNVLRLASSFRGPKISLKKKRNPNKPKRVKKFSKKPKKKSKKLRKAIRKMKKVKGLRKQLLRAQKNCRRNGFKRNSSSCRRSRRLSRSYRNKAKRVKTVVVKNCRKLKTACFKRNWKCKRMFRLCQKAKKLTKNLRSAKASYFSRLFTTIIRKLN